MIDIASNAVSATVPLGDGPGGVAIIPDVAFAYVANHCSDTVSVIDIATNTVSATVPVGSGPLAVAITPDGASVYVANAISEHVSVITTLRPTPSPPPSPSAPSRLALVSPPTVTSAYMANTHLKYRVGDRR